MGFSVFFLSKYGILDNILFLVVLPDLGEIYHLFCHVINAPTSTPILEYKTRGNLKSIWFFPSFVLNVHKRVHKQGFLNKFSS